MPTILRKRAFGKRFEYITKEKLASMLSAGTARKLSGIPSYEEIDAPSPSSEPKPQVYETRELKAAKPTAPIRRTYRKTGAPKSDG